MTALANPQWKVSQMPPAPVRRFTVDEYHRMIDSGVLTADDPVELLEGWIVLKMPRTPPRDATIDLADEALRLRIPEDWRIRIQSAITTSESEPEPDLAVVRGPAQRYLGQHPMPQDVAFVIEVSGSSIDYDRNVKGTIYAQAGLAIYWVINLADACIEVYSGPSAGSYSRRQDCAGPADVPVVIGRQTIGVVPVRDLLA